MSGTLPPELSINNLLQTHESIPRNPLIAEVCYRVGFIDLWGRGIKKIVDACHAAKMPTPQIFERSGGLMIELLKVSGEVSGEVSGGILQLLRNDSSLTLPEVATVIGKSTRTIERATRKLREQGKLRRVGPNKGGHWEVSD